MQNIIYHTSPQKSEEEDTVLPIELEHTIQILLFPLFGAALSFLFLLFELIYQNLKITYKELEEGEIGANLGCSDFILDF